MADVPCALCGLPIRSNPALREDALSREHAPAKLFHPLSLRSQICGQLWTVPAHGRCNAAVKLDEEYFLQYYFGLVAVQNPAMGQIILADIRRRTSHRSTRTLIQRMLRDCQDETPGGVLLPPGIVRVRLDRQRVQNVILKTAKCLFYKEHNRYMPGERCIHFEMCENPEDVQELFDLLRHTPARTVLPSVFQYRTFSLEGMHLYSMLFWESFLFCIAFREPAGRNRPVAVTVRPA